MFVRGRSLCALALVASLVAGAIAASRPLPASAFDTGPHASITLDAVRAAGLNREAAEVAQVENWLTDYYTSTDLLPTKKCDLEKLHFDDLFTTNDVQRYWALLQLNTRLAAEKAEKDDDVLEFLVVLGMSLHVVQDFYSHSNWVELNGGSAGRYSTQTYFQAHLIPGTYTGWYPNCLNIPQGTHPPHGDYTSGLNHDSVLRPGYDRAYVYAYAASYEWTKNVMSWVLPSFKAKVASYAPTGSDKTDLDLDQQASIYMSEWIGVGADGHWNGNRSADTANLALFAAKWTQHDSVFVAKFKSAEIYASLSQNQYGNQPYGNTVAMTLYPISGGIFKMRTLSASLGITAPNHFFGYLTARSFKVAGEYASWYRDAAQPLGSMPWEQMVFVPQGLMGRPVIFTYALWEELGFQVGPQRVVNQQVQITSDSSNLTLSFECFPRPGVSPMCSGDIHGGPWSEADPYSTNPTGVSDMTLYFEAWAAGP